MYVAKAFSFIIIKTAVELFNSGNCKILDKHFKQFF